MPSYRAVLFAVDFYGPTTYMYQACSYIVLSATASEDATWN